MQIGDPFAVAHPQRFQLARREDRRQRRIVEIREMGANPFLGPIGRVEAVAMIFGNPQELAEIAVAARPSADGQEIDDLDEQPGMPAAGPGNGLDERLEPRDEPVVADAQQRTAGNVADAGGLDHDGAGAPAGKALVPAQYLGGDDPVLGCPPGHHRRNPSPALEG